MKTSGILLLTLILGAWGLRAAARETAQQAPEGIRLSSPQHDFGEIPLREVRTAEITLTAAAETAVVVSAETNCECTKADYPRSPLRRGDKALLRIRYEAREKGYFRKVVRLSYVTDGARREAQVVVTGNVTEK